MEDQDYPDTYIDVDGTEERLYELYTEYCDRDGTTPYLSDYLVWLDENYA